jgi:hypothetical protein
MALPLFFVCNENVKGHMMLLMFVYTQKFTFVKILVIPTCSMFCQLFIQPGLPKRLAGKHVRHDK